MNDPHVEALIYVVEHDESSDYSLAKTIETEHTTFRLKLEDSEARFELKEEVTSTRCVNDIRRRPSQPLIQWRFHPHTVHRDRRLRSTQGTSDA